MHFSSILTIVGAASLVGAAPSRKQFSVSQVKTERLVPKPPPAIIMAETYKKYGAVATMPEVVRVAAVNAAASADDGTATATPYNGDSEYLVPVQIGTPPQTLMLDFDTGSSDLWTFSPLQPSNQTSGHTLYDFTKSSTSSKINGATWNISYGDGSSAYGDVYTDTVSVGTSTFSPQAVEPARSVAQSFVTSPGDGLLGLAMSSINTVKPTKQKTFFDNIASSLSNPLFTVTLKKGAAGSYDFGYIDSSKYSGSITYVNVYTRNGFWEFSPNGYAIGAGAFNSTNLDAIADTGTTLLYLPSAIVAQYWSQNGGAYDYIQGGYTFACSRVLLPLTIGIGSYKAVVPGSYLNYAQISSTRCFGGLQPDTGIGFSILGDIFLKSQFVVFSATGPQLGFAPQNSGQSSTTVATSTTSSVTSVVTNVPVPTSTSSTSAPAVAASSSKTSSTATTKATPVPTALGCYVDTVNPRTFNGAAYTSDTAMTNANCRSFCTSKGFKYSATEYSRECYCSSSAPTTATSTKCTMKCTGDSGICGGSAAMSVTFAGN